MKANCIHNLLFICLFVFVFCSDDLRVCLFRVPRAHHVIILQSESENLINGCRITSKLNAHSGLIYIRNEHESGGGALSRLLLSLMQVFVCSV